MASSVKYPTDHDIDVDAERADRRYAQALQRVTVSDVLSEVDHVIAEEPDERKHPLFNLARHVLRYGGFRRRGQRAHMADHLGMVFEDLLEEAVERLVQEELASGVSWGD